MIEWVDKVEISSEDKSFLQRATSYFFERLKISKKIVFVLVSEEEIKELNQKYRKKNKPTDVLSFEPSEKKFLGELVFCPQVVSMQAREHGFLFKEELAYLVLHGTLHLLGYDHEKEDKEAQKMLSLQDEIFDDFLDKEEAHKEQEEKESEES